jgi:hypothetical protein
MGAPVGNNNAGKAAKFREYIKGILDEMDEAMDPPKPGATLDAIVHGYIRDAATDPEIRKDFLDRMFGKPKQEIDHGNSGGMPFALNWPLPKTTLDQ